MNKPDPKTVIERGPRIPEPQTGYAVVQIKPVERIAEGSKILRPNEDTVGMHMLGEKERKHRHAKLIVHRSAPRYMYGNTMLESELKPGDEVALFAGATVATDDAAISLPFGYGMIKIIEVGARYPKEQAGGN